MTAATAGTAGTTDPADTSRAAREQGSTVQGSTVQGITVQGLTKSYGRTEVLRGIDLHLAPGRVYGLLGANGVGKTTLMSVICNHTFRTGGSITIDGQDPRENAPLLARTCFIHEDQRWHDDYKVRHILDALTWFHPASDTTLASRLLDRFGVPRSTALKKLSRGQRSSLAIALSLASRAPYTFLDEPHLGLDATARSIFYEELMRDISQHPRTVIMSTHLIDEAAGLFEEVLLMRRGRVEIQADVEEVTSSMVVVRGLEDDVDAFVAGRDVVSRHSLGRIRSVLLRDRLSSKDQRRAEQQHLSIEHAGLQEIVAALGILDHPDPTAPADPTASSKEPS